MRDRARGASIDLPQPLEPTSASRAGAALRMVRSSAESSALRPFSPLGFGGKSASVISMRAVGYHRDDGAQRPRVIRRTRLGADP